MNDPEIPNPTRRETIVRGLSLVIAGALVGRLADVDMEAGQTSGNLVFDFDFPDLQSALDATPARGILALTVDWKCDAALLIDKSVSLFFTGGSITCPSNIQSGIKIASDDVSIINPVLNGAGGESAGGSSAILAIGSQTSPLSRLNILGGRIQGWNKNGISLESVKNFTLDGIEIDKVAYSGIALLSCTDGAISSCHISNIHQPAGFSNSYGIAVTRDSSMRLEDAPLSERISVHRNTIDSVHKWEGIDTHGGIDIAIVDNQVSRCRVGIAAVSCPDESEIPRYAPKNITIRGNMISAIPDQQDLGPGIQLVGATLGPDETLEYATGIVSENVIAGHGSQNGTSAPGGISLYATQGVAITSNLLQRVGTCGLHFYYDNWGCAVAANVITDVTSTDGRLVAGVFVQSVNNVVSISGTTLALGTDTIKRPLAGRGLHISNAQNDILDGGGNLWHTHSIPVSGATEAYTLQSDASALSFFGRKPITVPTVMGSRKGESDVTRSLRTAMARLGLIDDQTQP